MAALENQEDILRDNLQIYERSRSIAMKHLDSFGDKVSYIAPEGAYFLFPKIHDAEGSVDLCRNLLVEQKLALVPGAAFGPGGEGHLRVCFGRDPGAVDEGMRRLGLFLSGW